MSVELFVEPNTIPVTWEHFQAYPAGSIALDGYVRGAPRFDAATAHWNANHHEDVDRLSTSSTAQQIFNGFKNGRDKPFRKNGGFSPSVYVNDCDADVSASMYLLTHPYEATNSSPSLNRFIHVAGMLDVTAGARPNDPDMPLLKELRWVFEPYDLFRWSGEINRRDAREYRSVIESIMGRMQLHLVGRGKTVELDGRYNVLGGGVNWKMVEEIGVHGRTGMFQDGIEAFVSVKQIEPGRWRYSIGKISEGIPFDVGALYKDLNELEGAGDDCWGGADTIGGSPRVNGSRLSPDIVEAAVNQRLAMARAA